MAGWFGGTALYYPPPGLAERLAQMATVRIDDIAAVATQIFAPDNLAVVAVGTLSRARLGELRQSIHDWR